MPSARSKPKFRVVNPDSSSNYRTCKKLPPEVLECGGSTDVGDVSWVVPVAGFGTSCWAPGTPGHSWQAVASGGTTIGKKGMNLAARTLAATAWDLFTDPDIRPRAKAEHASRLAGRKYAAMLEENQRPPLDYRDAPNRAGE